MTVIILILTHKTIDKTLGFRYIYQCAAIFIIFQIEGELFKVEFK